jgi:ATP-dependent DNA helicase UvrD/PcrA
MKADNLHLEIDQKRQAIIDQIGHLVVRGGPGSGKTTVALLKAKLRCSSLKPGQEVLFLSFSRAAVRQILERCKGLLTRNERRSIDVKTYHAFCMDLLRSYGRMIGGRTCRFVLPADERIHKSNFDGDWNAERNRRAIEENSFCFDLFASGAATLLERSKAVRTLYGEKYPLVIVDEFQDTDDDQWRMVRALAGVAQIFCLADPEQRIFEYRSNIDPKRLEALREVIKPSEHDLGSDNHRSPEGGILDYANAILHNRAPLPLSENVKVIHYYPNNFETMFHVSVIWTFARLKKRNLQRPCVAILCRTNSFLAKLSLILAERHVYKGKPLAPMEHDVVWDADLSAASASVVASIMEWPCQQEQTSLAKTLGLISHYFRLKNAERPSNLAYENARKFAESAAAIKSGKQPKIRAARELSQALRMGVTMTGNPVEDWKGARRPLAEIEALIELYNEVRMVRLFGARDALAKGLGTLWVSTGSYAGATGAVKRVLDRERLLSSDREPKGCVLMTIHKSKGKEFDAVVVVEGPHVSPFFDQNREKFPFEKSRRLFRVALTRAKTYVTMVRPQNTYPLVSG